MHPTRGVVAGEGGVAAFAELGEEQALDGHGIRRSGAAGGDILRDIGGARLERDSALAGGGDHIGERDGLERKARPFLDTEAVESGSGEVGGVGIAVGQFLQARVDVAA